MREVTVSGMREGYAQTVLTFRITYVLLLHCNNGCTKAPPLLGYTYIVCLVCEQNFYTTGINDA